jgi:Fe-Mn family superoxide dismutase
MMHYAYSFPFDIRDALFKHYLTYTNNLNNAIAGTEYQNQSIENILSKDLNNADLRNNAGGYYNHSLYWKSMAPNTGGKLTIHWQLRYQEIFGS